MKIECLDKKTIVYVYRYLLDLDNNQKLNEEIKNIFIKLIKVYQLDFFGYNRVHIYHHGNYGSILEIENIYHGSFNDDIIDLKIIMHKDTKMYLEFDDYYFDNLEIKDGKYYLDLDKVNNIYPYLEYGRLIYCSK